MLLSFFCKLTGSFCYALWVQGFSTKSSVHFSNRPPDYPSMTYWDSLVCYRMAIYQKRYDNITRRKHKIIKGIKMECEFPTLNSNKEEIKEIFSMVKTIAVLGLSPDASKASHRVAKYLQEVGYKIIPVYPKEDEILGEKVYRSLEEIPCGVDMVDIFRKPKALEAIAEACINRGDVKVFWAQQGIVNNEAAQSAQNTGMKVVQNRCAMVDHKNL